MGRAYGINTRDAFCQSSRLSPEAAASVRIDLIRKREGDKNFLEFARRFLERGSAEPGECIPSPMRCRAGRSSFAVNWQGMMRPCVMLSGPEEPVFELSFLTAWERTAENCAKIRISARCNACTMREVCQTCAACAMLEAGRFDRTPEYMCQYTKEILRLMKAALKEEQKTCHK